MPPASDPERPISLSAAECVRHPRPPGSLACLRPQIVHARPMKRLLALSVCLALAGFETFTALAHSANEPAPRRDRGWQNRQELLNRRAAEAGEKAQIIFVGDSITEGWEGAGRNVWAHYYAQRNAVNLGIGGDRTQHVLWRLDHGNIDGLKPKVAVVMIGTNNSNGEDNTPGQIVDGVRAIVQELRDKLPDTKVLLVAIFPRNENYSPQRGKILEVNQVLRKLADNRNIFWLDFGYRFVNDDGLIPAALMPDYLHPTERGYEIWAEAMERRISSILGDEPVRPMAANRTDLNGEWASTLRGADGQTFESRLILAASGNTVTGRFSRGEDRWLQIQNGELNGNELSCIVKRDRPDGSIMTYRLSGKVENGQITGTARTQLDGDERSMQWTARKK
jgi:lysophospholipase L1-like esterase